MHLRADIDLLLFFSSSLLCSANAPHRISLPFSPSRTPPYHLSPSFRISLLLFPSSSLSRQPHRKSNLAPLVSFRRSSPSVLPLFFSHYLLPGLKFLLPLRCRIYSSFHHTPSSPSHRRPLPPPLHRLARRSSTVHTFPSLPLSLVSSRIPVLTPLPSFSSLTPPWPSFSFLSRVVSLYECTGFRSSPPSRAVDC